MYSSWEHKLVDTSISAPAFSPFDLEQISDEAFWELVRQRTFTQSETSSLQCLECKLQSGNYLIAIDTLLEVVLSPQRLTFLPGMPSWMAGITAWRGETIAVVYLDAYLLPEQQHPYTKEKNGILLVAGRMDQMIGLLIPAYGSTSTVELEKIMSFPSKDNSLSSDQRDLIYTGTYADLPVINLHNLLASLVQQIGMANYHG